MGKLYDIGLVVLVFRVAYGWRSGMCRLYDVLQLKIDAMLQLYGGSWRAV